MLSEYILIPYGEPNFLALDLNTQIAPGQIIVSQEHQIDQEQGSIQKVNPDQLTLEMFVISRFSPLPGTRK